jgi:hypothetical protein
LYLILTICMRQNNNGANPEQDTWCIHWLQLSNGSCDWQQS